MRVVRGAEGVHNITCGALVQVELHRMRLSLSEISRERDALRSHVRLLHQQLADNAIHTALDQRKAQQPRPMQAGMRRGAGGGACEAIAADTLTPHRAARGSDPPRRRPRPRAALAAARRRLGLTRRSRRKLCRAFTARRTRWIGRRS